ncbi:MAG TPA: O-methyltransferase [Vicinamibacterales bacterium]|nr:O-methyltransferase [Vicinamibacterales bacterium]
MILMSAITAAPVLDYLAAHSQPPHVFLDAIAADGRHRRLPIVHAATGALLHALTRTTGAMRVLEIGTAIGYSALWIASALPPGGMLITLEREQARATAARAHLVAAGVADQVSVMVGDAGRYLHKVAGPFDLIFQDGDKTQYSPMFDRLVELLRPGGTLVTDNILWSGEVVPGYVTTPEHDLADTAAIATYNQKITSDPRVFTTLLPIGDGVAVTVKR